MICLEIAPMPSSATHLFTNKKLFENSITDQISFSWILMIISIMSSSPATHVIQFRIGFGCVCESNHIFFLFFFVDEHVRQLHEDMDCNVNLYRSVNYYAWQTWAWICCSVVLGSFCFHFISFRFVRGFIYRASSHVFEDISNVVICKFHSIAV